MKATEFLELSPGEQSAFVTREILGTEFHIGNLRNLNANSPNAMMQTVERMIELGYELEMGFDSYKEYYAQIWKGDDLVSQSWSKDSLYLAVHIAAGLALGILEEG